MMETNRKNVPEQAFENEADTAKSDSPNAQVSSFGRDSWEAVFKAAKQEETTVLDDADLIENAWDQEEWEW